MALKEENKNHEEIGLLEIDPEDALLDLDFNTYHDDSGDEDYIQERVAVGGKTLPPVPGKEKGKAIWNAVRIALLCVGIVVAVLLTTLLLGRRSRRQ